MIRIVKRPNGPVILRTHGKTETAGLNAQADAGLTPDGFKKDIYGHKTVKIALRKAQHDKCAFCESKVAHISYGDVEHYRPKAGVAQVAGDPLERPGYYWLAYEWSNLFFCCQLCNQRFKRNLFPLRDPARRVRSHRDHADLPREECLLIDPSTTDPAAHIHWRGEYPKSLPASQEGQTTIDVMGLGRDELVQARRERLRMLRDFAAALTLLRERRHVGLSGKGRKTLARLERRAEALQRDTAPYAAMARAVFASEL